MAGNAVAEFPTPPSGSDRLLRVMDARITLPERLVYEYVTAILDVGREELEVLHLGRHVKTLPFRLGD